MGLIYLAVRQESTRKFKVQAVTNSIYRLRFDGHVIYLRVIFLFSFVIMFLIGAEENRFGEDL